MVNFQDGASCLFWEDLWLHKVPKHSYPKLFSFAKNPWISLKQTKEEELDNLLYLLISNIALHPIGRDDSMSDPPSRSWGVPRGAPRKAGVFSILRSGDLRLGCPESTPGSCPG